MLYTDVVGLRTLYIEMIDPRARLPSQSLPAARSSTHCSRDQRITGFSTITSKCLPLPSQMETYCRAKALLFSIDSRDLSSAITIDSEKHQLSPTGNRTQASRVGSSALATELTRRRIRIKEIFYLSGLVQFSSVLLVLEHTLRTDARGMRE